MQKSWVVFTLLIGLTMMGCDRERKMREILEGSWNLSGNQRITIRTGVNTPNQSTLVINAISFEEGIIRLPYSDSTGVTTFPFEVKIEEDGTRYIIVQPNSTVFTGRMKLEFVENYNTIELYADQVYQFKRFQLPF